MAISTREILEKRGELKNGIFNAANIKRRKKEGYSLRRILTGPFAFEVQLIKIECLETEDLTGSDDLSLDIFPDREYENSLKFRLNNGESKTLGSKGIFHYKHRISLLLYEHDSVDPDDFLGKITISSRDPGENKIRFKGDGAKYDLHYKVITKYHFPETAQEIVEAFRHRTTRPVWTKILRNKVADQLKERIAEPDLDDPNFIDQGPSAFCGPAAVLFELSRHMPRRYVQMVIDLYENGSWKSASGTIKAPQGLLSVEVYVRNRDDTPMPEVDWIALTSMRDSANALFSLDEPDDIDSPIQAFAMTTEVAAWCPQLLGWRDTDIYTTTLFAHLGFKLPVDFGQEYLFGLLSGDAHDGLKEARTTLNLGGAVMLQINTDLINAPEDPTPLERVMDSGGNISTHFVSIYDKNVSVSRNGQIKFTVFTWGGTREIDVSSYVFEREMFAYVLTKPGAPI